MAGQLISTQPQVVNLSLYAGDGVTIRFTCKNSAGAPVDLTGTITSQIRVQRLDADPAIVEFTANLVDAYKGIVVLSLTGDQTRELIDQPTAKAGKFVGVWDVQWTPSTSEPYTICQGTVECVADVTRP